ncbi:deoxyribonuclease IV [soil metagenome]
MPLFGAHLSIAGGLHNAVTAAVELQCETLQIFSKNASQWAAKPLTDGDIDTFRNAVKASKLKFVTAHDSYLINLAAPDDTLWQKSINAFTDEVERAEALGLSYLVMHPGAHTGSGDDAALAKVVTAFDEVHRRTAGFKVTVLVETTAGQGTTLGWKFEHLAHILDNVKESKRLGVCVDTCHIFAAGYAVHTPEGYTATFEEFDDKVGLKRIKCFHVNDSIKGVGCRVDRHAGLGLGSIGLGCFERLVRDERFAKLPMILETPKEDKDGAAMDPVNLGILRRYRL